VVCLIFISLIKTKEKPTKETIDQANKMIDDLKNRNVKLLSHYWTLGRYDAVIIFEAPTEKDAMKLAIEVSEGSTIETMVAIPREEAVKLL